MTGSCASFGTVSRDWSDRERRIGGRQRESDVVLSGGELDGGRRAIM